MTLEIWSYRLPASYQAVLVTDTGRVVWSGPLRYRNPSWRCWWREAGRTAHQQACADGRAELELRQWLRERRDATRAAQGALL